MIHLQNGTSFFPRHSWPQVMTELARLLKLGGWLNLVDFEMGPASELAVDRVLTLPEQILACLNRSTVPGWEVAFRGKDGCLLKEKWERGTNLHCFGQSEQLDYTKPSVVSLKERKMTGKESASAFLPLSVVWLSGRAFPTRKRGLTGKRPCLRSRMHALAPETEV